MASGKEYSMMFALNASVNSSFQAAFTAAQKPITELQQRIEQLHKAQSNISAYQKQQSQVQKTQEKLAKLKQEHDELQKELGESGTASEDLRKRMQANDDATTKASADLDKYSGAMDSYGSALQRAGVDVNNLDSESKRLNAEIGTLKAQQDGAAASVSQLAQAEAQEAQQAAEAAKAEQEHGAALGQAMEAIASSEIFGTINDGLSQAYEMLKQCTEQAIQFESAMAAVKRTTGGNDSYIDALGDSFKQLSTEIPITANELAGIAASAGQLGIAQENIESFTTTMAQLATTTDLSADDAATMLAQFANITGTTQYDRLGATVAKLGDSTATTASKVVQMSQGMAAAASQAGMSERDILAISAAVGSLGIEAAAGSTSMSTLISDLYKAVETGDGLEDYAKVAGMSAQEFAAAWRGSPVEAMNEFIQGLNDTERNGKSAIVVLNDLGITNVRQTKAILGLASADGLLASTIEQANQAWDENTALAEKAGVMYDTTEAKMTMAQNALTNVQIAIGDALTPALGALAEAVTPVLQGIAEFIETNPQIVQAITTAVGVIGGVIAALGAFATAAKVATAAGALLSAAIPGLPLILGITAGVAGLAAGVVLLKDNFGEANQSMEELDAEFDSLTDKIQEQQDIIDLCERYKQLEAELGNTSLAVKELTSQDGKTVDITTSVNGVKKIGATDFTGGESIEVEISARQLADLKAAGFFESSNPDGTVTVGLTGEEINTLEAKGFFGDKDDALTVTLTAEQQEALKAAGFFFNEDDPTIKLTPEVKATLEAADCLDGTQVNLTPAAAETLEAEGFLKNGVKTIMLTAEQQADLLAKGFLQQGEDGTITLSAEADQQKLLDAAGFLVDREVLIDGKAGETIEAITLVDGTEIGLTGDVAEGGTVTAEAFVPDTDVDMSAKVGQPVDINGNIIGGAADLIPGGTDISLSGTVAEGGTIEASALVSGDPTVTISAELGSTADIEAKLTSMYKQVTTVGSDLGDAKQTLVDMQTEYDNLKNKLLATNEKAEKTEIQQKMDDLATSIENQKGKVSELETEYTKLNAEYTTTQTEAEAVRSKEAELEATKQALITASNGLITATDDESEAFYRQVTALEELAKAQQSDYRQQAYNSITKQSQAYVQAIYAEKAASEALDEAKLRSAEYEGWAAEGMESAYEELAALYQSLEDQAYSGTLKWDDVETQATVKKFTEMYNKLTGQNLSFTGFAHMDGIMDDVTISASAAGDAINEAHAEVAAYAQAVVDAEATQQTYLDNLVSGVRDGGMSMQELNDLLNEQFGDMEGGAEIIANAMNYVEQQISGAADAASDLEDSASGTADESARIASALDPALTKLAELNDAYNKAYDSALRTADGLFDTFEKVDTVKESDQYINTGNNSMREALDSQAKYFEEYAELVQKAKDLGVNTDLLSDLADGSEESMATLKRLTDTENQTLSEDIEALNAAYEAAQAGKETFATTMADIETNFTSEMATLTTELTDAVNNMEMSVEAAENARSTVQAYVDKVEDMTPQVKAAYEAMAREAARAFASVTISTPSVSASTGSHRYASGTTSAAQGLAIVGEEGPELVYFNGGEQVLNARDTAAMARDFDEALLSDNLGGGTSASGASHYEIVFSPSYNISGDADSAEVERVLREHDEELLEQVREQFESMLTDTEADRSRRVFV